MSTHSSILGGFYGQKSLAGYSPRCRRLNSKEQPLPYTAQPVLGDHRLQTLGIFLPRLPSSFWPLREEGSPGESVGGVMWGKPNAGTDLSVYYDFLPAQWVQESVVQPVSIFLTSSFLPYLSYILPLSLSPCGRQGDPWARDPWLSSASRVAVRPGEAQAPIL